jgi:hypothetical protein
MPFLLLFGTASIFPSANNYDYPNIDQMNEYGKSWYANIALAELFLPWQEICMRELPPEKFFRDSVYHQIRTAWFMRRFFTYYAYGITSPIFESHFKRIYRDTSEIILDAILRKIKKTFLDSEVISNYFDVFWDWNCDTHLYSSWHRLLTLSGLYHDMGMLMLLHHQKRVDSCLYPLQARFLDQFSLQLDDEKWKEQELIRISCTEPVILNDKFLSDDFFHSFIIRNFESQSKKISLNIFQSIWEDNFVNKKSPFFDSELFDEIYKSVSSVSNKSIKSGHGVIGALLLDKLPLQCRQAIAIHDRPNFKVRFDRYPIAFLLILADELQDWNRHFIEGGRHRDSIDNVVVSCYWDIKERGEPYKEYVFSVTLDYSNIKNDVFKKIVQSKYLNLKRLLPACVNGIFYPMVRITMIGDNNEYRIVTTKNGEWNLDGKVT